MDFRSVYKKERKREMRRGKMEGVEGKEKKKGDTLMASRYFCNKGYLWYQPRDRTVYKKTTAFERKKKILFKIIHPKGKGSWLNTMSVYMKLYKPKQDPLLQIEKSVILLRQLLSTFCIYVLALKTAATSLSAGFIFS